MSRAPGPVGVLFGLGLATVILLAGPLLLFNPVFTGALQDRHGVADAFGTTSAEVDRVTGELLGDILVGGDFDAAFGGEGPILDARERSHMTDVSRLVQVLAIVTIVGMAAAAVAAWALRGEPARQGRIMLTAAGTVGAVAVVLALVFAIAFEPAFLAFHAVFFPPGTYLFEPGSDLITLFPGGFWFDASLAAGVTIILAAVVVALIGFLRLRNGRRMPSEA